MNLEKIKNDKPELFEKMLKFHKSPSTKVFNKVISELTDDLYKEEQPDKIDEFFITLEGETWEDKRRRLKEITNPTDKQKEKQKYDNCKIVYTNPRVLSWIYAATKEFPWLILESSSTLIIERSIHYTEEGFYSLSNKIIKGIAVKKDKNDKYGSFERWKILARNYIEQSLMRYAASGNKYYLDYLCEVESMISNDSINEEIPGEPTFIKTLFRAYLDKYIKRYFTADEVQYLFEIYSKSTRVKGKEKAE